AVIQAAQRARRRAARGSEGRKTESREDARRAAIPGIGDHESARSMQVAKSGAARFLIVAVHAVSSGEAVSLATVRHHVIHDVLKGVDPDFGMAAEELNELQVGPLRD